MSIDDVTRWTQYDVPWEARAGFTFNLCSDSICLQGGFNNNKVYNDLWTFPIVSDSIQHEKWAKKSDSVFSNGGGRYGHGACYFQNHGLVLFGGMSHDGNTQNDVVKASRMSDELKLETVLLHAPWKARVWFGYACVPHAETIALAAGYHKTETSSSTLIDDMWYSKDGGQSWIGTGAFPWAGRYSLGMEFVHNQGKLFIFGGRGSRQYYNDVWSTEDYGRTWKEEAKAPWRPCFNFATTANVLTNNSFYMFGGFFSALDLSDIWQYTVGQKWERLEASAVWGSRNAFGAIHDSQNRVIIAGGRSSTGFRSDMWSSLGDAGTGGMLNDEALKIAVIVASIAFGLFAACVCVRYGCRYYKTRRRKHLYRWMEQQVEEDEEVETSEVQIFPRPSKASQEVDDLTVSEFDDDVDSGDVVRNFCDEPEKE